MQRQACAITPRDSVKKRAMAALDSIVFDVARAESCVRNYSRMQFRSATVSTAPTEAPPATNVHIVTAKADTPPNGVREPCVPQFVQALTNVIPAAIRALPIGKPLET
jgi:hypothetical protein